MNFLDIVRRRKETMTAKPTPTIDRVSHPDFTRPTRILSLRDVPDVEAYVIHTLREAKLAQMDGALEELVAAGIESVYRLERALPPERPLLPLLDEVLPGRLAELWRSAHVDSAASSNRGAAIAA
jgi:hypothetical protein